MAQLKLLELKFEFMPVYIFLKILSLCGIQTAGPPKSFHWLWFQVQTQIFGKFHFNFIPHDRHFSSEFHSIYTEYISQVYILNLIVFILNYYLVTISYFHFISLLLIPFLLWKHISDSFQSWKDAPQTNTLKQEWTNEWRAENQG